MPPETDEEEEAEKGWRKDKDTLPMQMIHVEVAYYFDSLTV